MRKTLLLIALGLFLGANVSQACGGDKAKAMKASDKGCCAKMASKKACTDAEKKACLAKEAKADKAVKTEAAPAVKNVN